VGGLVVVTITITMLITTMVIAITIVITTTPTTPPHPTHPTHPTYPLKPQLPQPQYNLPLNAIHPPPSPKQLAQLNLKAEHHNKHLATFPRQLAPMQIPQRGLQLYHRAVIIKDPHIIIVLKLKLHRSIEHNETVLEVPVDCKRQGLSVRQRLI
jgi:hypothetical protein